jgi:tetratricopeptide (TPR) repeat protein
MHSLERRRIRGRWIGALVAVLALAVAAPVASQDDDGEKSAKKEKKEKKINAYREFRRANRLAGAGAWTRSIPHYEKVLEAEPRKFAFAHFNLAEVYKAKGNCGKAALLYHAYTVTGKDAESREQARKEIEKCAEESWATLTVDVDPEKRSVIRVDGYIVAENADLEKLRLPAGSYDVSTEVEDHHPASKTVELEEKQQEEIELRPEMKVFYGEVEIDVSHKGAAVSLTPKKLENTKVEVEPVEVTSPMEKSRKLPTGKYFLEVNKKGFNRWIRNIYIRRGETTAVEVQLSKALPEEIR